MSRTTTAATKSTRRSTKKEESTMSKKPVVESVVAESVVFDANGWEFISFKDKPGNTIARIADELQYQRTMFVNKLLGEDGKELDEKSLYSICKTMREQPGYFTALCKKYDKETNKVSGIRVEFKMPGMKERHIVIYATVVAKTPYEEWKAQQEAKQA